MDFEVTTIVGCPIIIGQAREGCGEVLERLTIAFLKDPVLPQGEQMCSRCRTMRKICVQYMGVVIDVGSVHLVVDAKNASSLAGGNRINNVVDVTNYIRLDSASRYMCLTMSGEGKKIVVRRAKQGEHFRALDGTEHELSSDMRDC